MGTDAMELTRIIKESTYTYVFISLGIPSQKAKVKVFKKTGKLPGEIKKFQLDFKKEFGRFPAWVKIDLVKNIKTIKFEELKGQLETTRRNYVKRGFVLDKDWEMAFIPEEINANAFLKPDQSKLILSEKNINVYLKRHCDTKKRFSIEDSYGKDIFVFDTISYMRDQDGVHPLIDKGMSKGLRKVDDLNTELARIIRVGTGFLQNMMKENGKYTYGYFPHFDRSISFYNNLRHASSTYSLIEGTAFLNTDMNKIEPALNYLIDGYCTYSGEAAYIFDDSKDINEIKLGQNATLIMAICEFLKYEKNDRYLAAAQSLADGILTMIDRKSGKTTHVLDYPSLEVKNKFRVIYYDGEAALALLRLYQIDKNSKWLDTVKMMFENFIENDYWKYHDHWLGYCTNELVKIIPEEKYFIFGMKNVSQYLDYINQRETTFPTFLEMLTSTYQLVQKMKGTEFEYLIKKYIDEKKLIQTMHNRADYQRIGFFYPETAMYFKNPQRILGGLFIKHHGYRVRIDDIEHYLSGFIQYLKIFENVTAEE